MTRWSLLSLLVFASSVISCAQSGLWIGPAGAVSIPIGNVLVERAGIGFGAFAAGEYLFDYSEFALAASLGYVSYTSGEKISYWKPNADVSVKTIWRYTYQGIIIKMGGKLYLPWDQARPYIQGTLGAFISTGERSYASSGDIHYDATNSWSIKSDMILSPAVGIAIDTGSLLLDFSGNCDILPSSDFVALTVQVSILFPIN
jgi:hypothetical protein